MLKIVKDTGCINAKEKVDVLNFIEEMERKGKVEILMITPSEKELKKYKKGYEKYLRNPKEYEYGRFNISEFDKCVFGNSETEKRAETIARKLFQKSINDVINFPKPNSLRDVMIINRAIGLNADYFLTIDKNHFIKNSKAEWFRKEYNIKVRYVDKENTNEKLISEIKHDL